MIHTKDMKVYSESLLNVLFKGILGLIIAIFIAYCIVAISAGDGQYGLIELLWNV